MENKSEHNQHIFETCFTESFLDHLYEGVYFVDKQRRIQFWNKGAEKMTGFGCEEILNEHCYGGILCHEDENGLNLCMANCPLIEAIDYGKHVEKRVYLRHKQGYKIPVWVHVTPIKDKEGNVVGAVEIFENDSAYEELKQANAKLEHLNEIKNQFLGMAAHDLRNPLTVARSFSQLLLQFHKNKLEEDQISIIQKILKACNQMNDLIADLLDITAIESGKINLKKKLISISNLFDPEHYAMSVMAKQKNISLNLIIEENLPDIEVDSERINQVMENLLSNAVKYSYPETEIQIKITRNDANIIVSVIDQGQGIPEDEQKELFKPFQTTSVKPTGTETSTGLGLVIVRKIVRLHGGTISVESEIGKGSCFTFTLPINKTDIGNK